VKNIIIGERGIGYNFHDSIFIENNLMTVNGTSAIHLALIMAGVTNDDEILCQSCDCMRKEE